MSMPLLGCLTRKAVRFTFCSRAGSGIMGATAPPTISAQANKPMKRAFNEGKRHFKKNKKQKVESDWPDGSNEDVLVRDVDGLLRRLKLSDSSILTANGKSTLPQTFTEVDVDIEELSSVGDGLGVIRGSEQVVVVPFTVPGDRVTAKLIRHDPHHAFTVADFIKVVNSSDNRDDSRIGCKYFAKCSGCQFQMMRREDQLAHKRTIIEKAYRYFSKLPTTSVPAVGNTIHGPREYGYRTKLTPHFEAPAHARRDRRHGQKVTWEGVPPIGFMQKGTRKTLDIEDCPIGTSAVREGLKRERLRVAESLDSFQRGATLLCREHTVPLDPSAPPPPDAIVEQTSGASYIKTCITDAKLVSTEYVAGKRFDNPAGAFFQNNNDILSLFISHVRKSLLGSLPAGAITHLVDAYSGSGLFTVSLSDAFEQAIGIDVSAQSIAFATRNAELNNIPSSKARFLAGDAADIFAHVRDFPADKTAVVIDPSRKGCDRPFLSQLLEFAPRRVAYVSCNVHTQARDVGVLCDPESGKYDIESIDGFDFFPLTAHVEGLAILKRRERVETSEPEEKAQASLKKGS